MSVYYTLPFLGLLQVPVMGQKGHLLNAGTCRSWCRGRARSALPQPEGTDSIADGETREPGASLLPALGQKYSQALGQNPFPPVRLWLSWTGFAVGPGRWKGCSGTPAGELSSSRTQTGFSLH